MMALMIKDEGISFKQLEEEIFRMACSAARELTRELLEKYDQRLMEERDRKAYRHKGYRATTVKTRYGEVEYKRAVYETVDEEGFRRFVYLLDETLDLKETGLISAGMAEILVKGIMNLSYRECARKATGMTGQAISATGVWNVIQALGERACLEEKELVKAYKAGQVQGKTRTGVLFEESDGVYLSLQGADRKRLGRDKAEMKVGIAYDGWKEVAKGRFELTNKVVVAGFSRAREFQEYREAAIAEKYDLNEVGLRVLNGDGASWIKRVEDPETVFQLDPFHRNKAVREKLSDKRAIHDVMEMLKSGETREMFEYLETYKNSVSDDYEIKNTGELIRYFRDNEDGLLPYQWREEVPGSPEGKEYRNLGTMESHVWSVIAYRMKNNHAGWSIRGGHHLAKLLAKKACGKLGEVINPLKRPLLAKETIEETGVLSAGNVASKMGKGYAYPVTGRLAALGGATRGDRKRLLYMAGY